MAKEVINKMTEEDKKDWDELYKYVRKEILGYDDNIKLPQFLVLRLKGLLDGKFCANNNNKQSLAHYTYKEILLTFKINRISIQNSIKQSAKFKDEKHRINYIMAIIENKINDVALRNRELKRADNKINSVDINLNENKASYKHKSKEVKNSRLKGLL